MGILNRGGSKNAEKRANGYRKPARYSAFDLVRHGLLGEDWPLAWRVYDLRPSYDVVIVGGGVHGLATAYYLAANHGITNVAVLEKGYIGSGTPAMSLMIVLQPAVQLRTWPARIVPRFVRTTVMRSPVRSSPVTSV